MTPPAKTLLAFGLYLAAVGTAFLAAPGPVLAALGLPPSPQIWARVVGLLALYLALYDIAAARGNWVGFIRLSVPLRMSALAVFVAFVWLLDAPRLLLLFGAVDLAAATWTWRALGASPSR